MKIYTKTGDEGDTTLFGGKRVRKSASRVEAYGTIDELNSIVGMARAEALPDQADKWLEQVQNDLFHLGADLATPLDVTSDWVVRIEPGAIEPLEQAIDQMVAELPTLAHFILPGGVPAAAALHVARTVCRRAERIIVQLGDEEPINQTILVYLNRLSDFLFTLARWVNLAAGESEKRWAVRS
jgi:cob(I)alamin adenosyltransferase